MPAWVQRGTGRVHSYYTCGGMSILISPWSAGRVPFPGRSRGLGFNKYTQITPTGNFYEAGISEL